MNKHPGESVPSDTEIRDLLIERIDAQKQSVGIVIGVIESTGSRIISHGSLAKDDQRSPDENSVFEIGSVTKVFTALLLADMAQQGELALTDPVGKYLPWSVRMPERSGRQITLLDLATHTSGLPRLPSNLKPKDRTNPYAGYSVEHLYQFLSSYKLPRDIGSRYEYSNLGGGLLGHVLAHRAATDYETLVRTRICAPLHMNSTGITLSPEMKFRTATGYNAALKPVPMWDLPTLAGAGALRSNAVDLLKFLAANLGYTNSLLAGAMSAMLAIRRPTGNQGSEVALGWHALKRDTREILWHNGGTGGFRSFLGFDPTNGVGIVALSNAGTAAGVDDVALRLLSRTKGD